MACGWARRSWIDAGEFLGVQAVGGSLTHVERRLGLRHRPLSSSLRCPDCGGTGRRGAKVLKKIELAGRHRRTPDGQFLARKKATSHHSAHAPSARSTTSSRTMAMSALR